MRTYFSKVTVGVAALALVTFGLAACGSDDAPEKPRVTESAADDTAVETQAPETTEPTEPADEPAAAGRDLTVDNFTEILVGAQTAAGSVHMVQTIETEDMTITTESDVILGDGGGPGMAMRSVTNTPGIGEQEVLMIDGVMYMRTAALSGDKWIRLGGDDSLLGDTDDLVAQFDLEEQIRLMEDAILDFATETGEVIDGVATTKVTMVMDMASFAGEDSLGLPGSDSGDGTMTQVMYVGEDGLLRRQVTSFSGATVTTDYTRWGEKFEIVAPSADQVTDMESLMNP